MNISTSNRGERLWILEALQPWASDLIFDLKCLDWEMKGMDDH